MLLKKSFVIHLCCLKNIVLEKSTISRNAIHSLRLKFQTVSLNSKFYSFLVRILIRKDNTDNKVFKREFYTKKKKERKIGIEKIKCCIFSAIYWNLSERVSGKQSSLNLSIFLFPFVLSKYFINLRVFFKVLFSGILG